MPVLARIFEAAGLSTIVLTNMPYWAERIGVPRTLAVEFPFGHIVGQPGNVAQQRRVLEQALVVLEAVVEPGSITHFQEPWPVPLEEALRDCHPPVPPPVMDHMSRHLFDFMRALRRSGK